MWPPKTILHPTDFSENAQQAFELACNLATSNDGKVDVLHAFQPEVIAMGELPPVTNNMVEVTDIRRKLDLIRSSIPEMKIESKVDEGTDNLIPRKSKSPSTTNGDWSNRNGLPAIQQMRQELDQVFQRFFGDFSKLEEGKPSWVIAMEEKEDSVIARFEPPGIDLKDVELKQIGNVLVLKAENKSETKDKDSSK